MPDAAPGARYEPAPPERLDRFSLGNMRVSVLERHTDSGRRAFVEFTQASPAPGGGAQRKSLLTCSVERVPELLGRIQAIATGREPHQEAKGATHYWVEAEQLGVTDHGITG